LSWRRVASIGTDASAKHDHGRADKGPDTPEQRKRRLEDTRRLIDGSRRLIVESARKVARNAQRFANPA
jgi:hypothetical protein